MTFSGIVEEEQLFPQQAGHPSSFTGNEDTGATPDNDADTQNPPDAVTNFNHTTNVATRLRDRLRRHRSVQLSLQSRRGPSGALHGPAGDVTSHGQNVLWHYVDGDTEVGYVELRPCRLRCRRPCRIRVQHHDTTTGAVNFTLYDNLDHPFGDNIESTRSWI